MEPKELMTIAKSKMWDSNEAAHHKGKEEPFKHIIVAGVEWMTQANILERSFYVGLKITMKDNSVLGIYTCNQPTRVQSDIHIKGYNEAKQIKLLSIRSCANIKNNDIEFGIMKPRRKSQIIHVISITVMYYGNIKNTILPMAKRSCNLVCIWMYQHCLNCFQPETWDFNYGKPYTKETEDEIIEALKSSLYQRLNTSRGRTIRTRESKRIGPPIKKSTWWTSKQNYLELHRICLRPGSFGWRQKALWSNRWNVIVFRCFGGWSIYWSQKEYLSSFSWKRKPKSYRYEKIIKRTRSHSLSWITKKNSISL